MQYKKKLVSFVYKSIWTYEISEKLRCDREENNANDKFAVKLVRNDGNKEQCVGHVPIELSSVLSSSGF
jgi:isopropylmalate/homocitrate/citramalate synthase